MKPFVLSARKRNLSRLCWIRGILLSVEIAASIVAYSADIPLPYSSLGIVFLTGLLIIVVSLWRTRSNRPWPVTELEFFCHLLIDVILLSLLLYLTGGATNPLVSFLLVPLTISSAVLKFRYTWTITAFSLIAYTTLLFYFLPVEILAMPHQHAAISPHIIGMWLTFLLSAVLITYFVTQMAEALRQQNRQLQQYREETLRDEQLLAIGSLAAGTAHDLGTPLSTMRIILTELDTELDSQSPIKNDIQLLNAQVDHCKSALAKLIQTARQNTSNTPSIATVQDFVAELLTQWQSIRPEINVKLDLSETIATRKINHTPSLTQAIMNLLNNAADVSEEITIKLFENNQQLAVTIDDNGPGLSQRVISQLGKPFITEGKDGNGLGLFLTHATIEKLGGSVSLENKPDGGTLTQAQIPFYQHA